MHDFRRADGRLTCEGQDLAGLARQFGTPTYVYSAATMRSAVRRIRAAFGNLDVRICYAVKANPHLAILRLFATEGAGFDLVSGGEVQRAIAAGCHGALGRSVFAGVGKTEAEIRLALEAGVFSFHVESEPELERIDAVAGRLGRRARIAIRVNPDVDAVTHQKITTGKKENKFGIPIEAAPAAFERAARLRNIDLGGVQAHIGSQITTLAPFQAAAARLVELAGQLKARHGIQYLSIGGGVGIVYQDALASGEASWWQGQAPGTAPITPESYGAAMVPILEPLGLPIYLEPGRVLVGNAGVLLTRVEYVKSAVARKFVIVDAGMNDLVRPAMYDSYHEILPCVTSAAAAAAAEPVDIVGPVCESGDCFAKARPLPPVAQGDVVALMSAGAYGAAMASRYNTRSLPAEVLVDGSAVHCITRRETFAQQVANELVPDFS